MALPQSPSPWLHGLSTTPSFHPQMLLPHPPVNEKAESPLVRAVAGEVASTVGPHFTKGLPGTCTQGTSQDSCTKPLSHMGCPTFLVEVTGMSVTICPLFCPSPSTQEPCSIQQVFPRHQPSAKPCVKHEAPNRKPSPCLQGTGA